jgi:WD40 repeat protein
VHPLQPGDPGKVGKYELIGLLGHGGQGNVYLGIGPDGQEVAVKLLHRRFSADPEARQLFTREIEAAGRVVGFAARILTSGYHQAAPYIVSEYVAGDSLEAQVAADGPYEPGALRRLASGTASALTAIHAAGIVHCDFKPANILIGPDGPRVIDFGIARALDTISQRDEERRGTPAFMAPEQITGGPVGPHTDVFAWASTMVFAATGRPPFGFSSDGHDPRYRIVNSEPDMADVPEPLRDVFSACLVKHPGRRPAASDVLSTVLGLQPPSGLLPLGTQIGDPLTGHTRTITCVAFGTLRRRPIAVTGGHDRTVRVWDLTDQRQLGAPLRHGAAVLALACGQLDGRTVAVTGCQDRTISLWDLEKGERVGEPLTGHSGAVVSIALGELDGSTVAVSVSDDRSVRLWDLAAQLQLGEPLVTNNTVMSVAAGELDGQPVAVIGGAYDQTVRLLDLASRRPTGNPLTGHTSTVMSVACGSLSGRPIAITGGYDQTVRIWNLTTRRQEGDPLQHSSAVMSVAYGVRGSTPIVLSSGADRSVRVWDLTTRKQLGAPLTSGPSTGPAVPVAYGQLDGRPIAITCGGDLAIRMWSLGPL